MVRVQSAILAILWAAQATAEGDLSASIEKAEWLVQRGQNEQAVELLRRVAVANPGSEAVAMARAKAYVADKNPFWALKVLGEYILQYPPACAARAMAARVHIEEANLEPADRMLDAPACERAQESKLRFVLLQSELAELRGERGRVSAFVETADGIRRRYVEDDARLTRLLGRLDPYRQPAFVGQIDVGTGWASHGTTTLPIDLPTGHRQTGALLLGTDLAVRWIPIAGKAIRPVAEAELHLVQYLDAPEKDFSSRQPILRLGASFGRGPRRSFVAYATDWVILDGGARFPNDAFSYSNGHRLETRTEVGKSFVAHSAFGYRSFWQTERNRRESAIGMAKSFELSDQLRFTMGADSRVYFADRNAYDQVGATGSVGLHIALPKGFSLQESLAVGYDFFPRSAGYFAPSDPRLDSIVRVNVGLSSPELLGLRFGLHYGFMQRESNAQAYDFTDHRGLLTVSWVTDSDRWRVERIAPSGRVTLPYPDDDVHHAAKTKSEIFEIIQRDESQRRGSSCMK